MNSLYSSIIPIKQLSRDSIESMYRLFADYYECTNIENFYHDLSHKNVVLQIFNEQQQLVGFTTILQYSFNFQDKKLNIIYSGDTIMAEQYWGNSILAFSWLKFAGSIKAAQPTTPLYWFIIVKGHRTYRYLPVFSKNFYPNYDKHTPLWEKGLMDELAIATFGKCYDATKGIVHFPFSKGHLKATWAEVPNNLQQRKEIQFFLKMNPNYHSGDELVCLCELEHDNLKPFARRLFNEGYQQHHEQYLVI